MQVDIHAGLRSLSPEELARLDQLITPEFAGLITKAFPDLGQLMQPFIQNDQAQQGGMPQQGAMPQGGGFAASGMQPPLAQQGQRPPY